MKENINSNDYKERLTNFSHEFDLGLFLHILRKSMLWLVFLGVVSVAAAYLYLRYTPEVFEAQTTLQLGEDDSANRVLNVNQFVGDNSIEAKVELIRSKLLIERTLTKIPVEISYSAKGEILTNDHYILSPYRIELDTLKNNRVLNKPLMLEFNEDLSFNLTVLNKTYPGLQVNEYFDLEEMRFRLVVINEEDVRALMNEYELFFRINNMQTLPGKFTRGLEVRVLNNTAKTIQIRFKDHNPYLARDFVTALSNEFIHFDLENRQRSDENILAFIDAQIDTVFEKLRTSEVMLNGYKLENKIHDLKGISGVYLDRLNDIENRVISLEVEDKILNEVKELAKKSASEVEIYNLVPLVAGSQYEGSLSGLLGTLQRLLLDREEALYTVTPDNHKIRGLDYQIGVQKKLVVETILALQEKIEIRKKENYAKLSEVEQIYYGLPTKELEFARLERLFTINEKYYTMLLEKRIEYRISKEGFVSQNQILEEAQLPATPIAPKRDLIVISFLLSGIVLGFVLISIRYLLHNEITTLNEIVRLSNASISTLGIIPRHKVEIETSMLIVKENSKSMIAEAFRSIRTNLQFIDNTEGSKMAAVTSTISGEGKTFVAMNLAGIFAFSGKKVVLVDLDMRKPKVHKGFKVANTVGMSTLLIGKSTLEESIHHSEVENLDYITAGPVPPNPSELIISKPMEDLLAELKKRYDLVVIDTPPVGLVTDGLPIIQEADYPLYIFRADFSKKQFIQNADRLINENHIRKLSVILNGIDLERSRYTNSYGYGYGYGYGYRSAYGDGYYNEPTKPRREKK
jgi:capsular exopolysaccharide synthesis family protein